MQKEAASVDSTIINKKRETKKREVESDEGSEATLANNNDTITTDTSVRLKQSVAGVVVAGTLAAGVSTVCSLEEGNGLNKMYVMSCIGIGVIGNSRREMSSIKMCTTVWAGNLKLNTPL